MAKSTETLNRIMKILNMSEMIKLAQETLENGTVIEADEFIAGADVFIVTEDGENVALPVGEYVMADGRVLVVSSEGVIGEIKEASAPEAEAPAPVEANEDEKKEDETPAEALNYVTKEELAQVVDEIKMMIEEVVKEMAEEVAEEKVEEKKEEEKVAMSSNRPARKPMRHKPEAKTAKPLDLNSDVAKNATTFERVMAKLAQ